MRPIDTYDAELRALARKHAELAAEFATNPVLAKATLKQAEQAAQPLRHEQRGDDGDEGEDDPA